MSQIEKDFGKGSIMKLGELKTTNVDIDKITPKISFDIHIKTNMNERYYRKMYLVI